ncbi:MAG: hypothetical protein AB198_02680 [Parcubacteria bacterium C7867-003]|nr:MAG: hypothetical protein AB198_02680 [Parcubacteria bacterium C7867-003]
MKNYFQGTAEHPYHISVGAIVKNEEGKICCHYFNSLKMRGIVFENFHLLMRESIEPFEPIETCLHRGLMEEFGMTAKLKTYVGSILSNYEVADTGIFIQKNTIYFLCDFVSIDESKRKEGDIEAQSKITWLLPDELIAKQKEEGKRFKREDLDESAVIENALKYF